ncbi:MAG: type II toxin-antitoxin system HicA family toxin [Bauldia sp.]|nr:MAG: type II toxin-antitoxin system HicA family toxin [Bauldia sp.]MBZ0229263.1 type II toxin-antitoxin system HicA family toxin [Bauldia sp.]
MAGARLPAVSGRRAVRALTSAGFMVDRIVGSHHVLVYPGNPRRTVTIPVHGGRELKPGTLRSIIRQAGFTVEEFISVLRET